jgi:hypothetical protein
MQGAPEGEAMAVEIYRSGKKSLGIKQREQAELENVRPQRPEREVIPRYAVRRLEEATEEIKSSRARSRATQREIERLKRQTRRVLDRLESRLAAD